jgi:hypothetical protein
MCSNMFRHVQMGLNIFKSVRTWSSGLISSTGEASLRSGQDFHLVSVVGRQLVVGVVHDVIRDVHVAGVNALALVDS